MTQPDTPATEKPGCPKCGSPRVNAKHQVVFRCGSTSHPGGLARTEQCQVNELQQALTASQERERGLHQELDDWKLSISSDGVRCNLVESLQAMRRERDGLRDKINKAALLVAKQHKEIVRLREENAAIAGDRDESVSLLRKLLPWRSLAPSKDFFTASLWLAAFDKRIASSTKGTTC